MADTLLGPVLALVVAFLTGSIPMGLILGKLRGVDLRTRGSGNIGATNAMRVLGKAWGTACLVFDIFKGYLPVAALGGATWAGAFWRPAALDRPTWMMIVGLAAIAGHMFSPWIGFKGGKGVATSLGVFLAVAPMALLVSGAVGAALIATTGYVSLGSMTAAVMMPIVIAAVPSGGQRPWPVIVFSALLAVLVVWKHRGNIARLRLGTESKIYGSKMSEPPDGKPDGKESKGDKQP